LRRGGSGCRVRVERISRRRLDAGVRYARDLARTAWRRPHRRGERKVTASFEFLSRVGPFSVPRSPRGGPAGHLRGARSGDARPATGFPPATESTRPPRRPHPTACSARAERVFPATGPPVCGSRRAPFLAVELRARGAKAVARPDGLNARSVRSERRRPAGPGNSSLLECAPGVSSELGAASSFGFPSGRSALPRAAGHLRREAA